MDSVQNTWHFEGSCHTCVRNVCLYEQTLDAMQPFSRAGSSNKLYQHNCSCVYWFYWNEEFFVWTLVVLDLPVISQSKPRGIDLRWETRSRTMREPAGCVGLVSVTWLRWRPVASFIFPLCPQRRAAEGAGVQVGAALSHHFFKAEDASVPLTATRLFYDHSFDLASSSFKEKEKLVLLFPSDNSRRIDSGSWKARPPVLLSATDFSGRICRFL